MAASPVDPIEMLRGLLSHAEEDRLNAHRGLASGQPEWTNRFLLYRLQDFFENEAAFKVLCDALETPPHKRGAEHLKATNDKERSARAEVAKAFSALRRLIYT